MNASEDELRAMSDAAVQCAFPLEAWQQRLRFLYDEVLAARAGEPSAPPPDPEHGGSELRVAEQGAAPPRSELPPPAAWAPRAPPSAPRAPSGQDGSPVRVSTMASQEKPAAAWAPSAAAWAPSAAAQATSAAQPGRGPRRPSGRARSS
ncbi:unnamed protein product [Prorocentrum cordatum]|uniref:Uncharacterized protein n=1 Tax=Prorocentrum cordatum TaxID=2364126 RepID=A0ABN9V4K3_9DINO|nr:unnamed protein product [Polarella glacialis]